MIAFFCILYFPENNALKNIQCALANGFKTYVYINKADESLVNIIKAYDVVVMGSNSNVGLGPAFYEFENRALEDGVSHFVYFDQDTVIEDQVWEHIKSTYKNNFFDKRNGLLFYTSDLELNPHPLMVISSGSVFSLDVIKNIGRHDSGLFVEGVDYEFCLRIRQYGLRIKIVHVEGIDHLSLQDGSEKKIWRISFKFRYYGVARIRDFNVAHLKLIYRSVHLHDYRAMLYFLRSLVAFNLLNFVSKFSETGK